MGAFVTSPCLRRFFDSDAGLNLSELGGLMIVPNLYIVRLVKNEILKTSGGTIGLEVLTADELKSHNRKVMAFEGAFVWAEISASSDWSRCRRIYQDVALWCQAGNPIDTVPLPESDRVFLPAWVAFFRRRRMSFSWEGGFLPHDKPVVGLGFDAMGAWELLRQNSSVAEHINLYLIEPDGGSVEQLAAMGSIEKIMGEPLRLEAGLQKGDTIAVGSTQDLKMAILEALQQQPQIDTLVWGGASAKSAIEQIAQNYPLVLDRGICWQGQETLGYFKQVQQSKGWSAQWEWWRHNAIGNRVDFTQVHQRQKECQKALEDSGEVSLADVVMLPNTLSLEELKQYLPEMLWEANQARFKKLRGLCDPQKKISKSIWLEILSAPEVEGGRTYAGVMVCPLSESIGLADSATLFIDTDQNVESTDSLLDLATVARHNKLALVETESELFLKTGWIYLNDGLRSSQMRAAMKMARSSITMDLTTADSIVRFKCPRVSGTRMPRQYQLPIKKGFLWGRDIPCKKWEEILSTPQLAWFSLLGLEGVWQPQKKDPLPLWIGTWAHEAVASGNVDAYFAKRLTGANNQALLRLAIARAWELATYFSDQLSGFDRVEFEQEIPARVNGKFRSGYVNGVPTHGRADAIAHIGTRTVIVDFKTSNSVGSIAPPSAARYVDRLAEKGIGWQLWLYGRMLSESVSDLWLCLLSGQTNISQQRKVDAPLNELENKMAQVAATGKLGYASQALDSHQLERLPYATTYLKEDA